MSITIKFSPTTERRLQAQAEATGKDVNSFVVEAVEARLALEQLSLREILRPLHDDFHRSGMTDAELETFLSEELEASRAERCASAEPAQ